MSKRGLRIFRGFAGLEYAARFRREKKADQGMWGYSTREALGASLRTDNKTPFYLMS